MLNSTAPAGNDQSGSISAELREGVLAPFFRDQIKRVCSLVQNQDLWVSDKRASKSQPLTLPPRERKTPVPKNRVEAPGKLLYERQGMSFGAGLDEFLAG